jgi:hypothetical protein
MRDKVKLEEQAASKRILDVQGKRIGVVELPGFYLDFEAARRGDPTCARLPPTWPACSASCAPRQSTAW